MKTVRAPEQYAELRRRGITFRTLFDVGANKGQTVRDMRNATRLATIHAFEPVTSTFNQLRMTVGTDPLTFLHRVALSDHDGEGMMLANTGSQINHLVDVPSRGIRRRPEHSREEGFETVPLMRGDTFCVEHGIRSIDLLKIDTEGHELEVLDGFAGMLGNVRAIQVEVAVSEQTWHIPIERYREYLPDRELVGVYGGVNYGNAVFV